MCLILYTEQQPYLLVNMGRLSFEGSLSPSGSIGSLVLIRHHMSTVECSHLTRLSNHYLHIGTDSTV